MTQQTPTFWQVLASVVAAALGVQKRKNLERDFQHGKPIHFILVGLLFTAVFIALVMGVVSGVMYLALK